jgi:hypothetical protein
LEVRSIFAESIERTNPDGDGEDRITAAKTSDHVTESPALLRRGDKLLCAECRIILFQEQACVCLDRGCFRRGRLENVF